MQFYYLQKNSGRSHYKETLLIKRIVIPVTVPYSANLDCYLPVIYAVVAAVDFVFAAAHPAVFVLVEEVFVAVLRVSAGYRRVAVAAGFVFVAVVADVVLVGKVFAAVVLFVSVRVCLLPVADCRFFAPCSCPVFFYRPFQGYAN